MTEENPGINNDNTVFCSKCGAKNEFNAKFCVECGNNLKTIEDNIKNTTQNIKDTINNNETFKSFVNSSSSDSNKASWNNKDMVDYIQKNPEYYIPKFEQIQEYNKSTSWNWASFLLGPLWFLYRKMYAFGFGFMVLAFILSYIPFIGWALPLACSVCYGIYGNDLYLKHLCKNLDEIKHLNEDAKHRVIISKGGVNLALPLIMAFFTSGIFFVIFIFSTMAMFMYY
ncbi:MAG: DUF2628 domain-containing protein [Peptostreptococcaceae bacterium]